VPDGTAAPCSFSPLPPSALSHTFRLVPIEREALVQLADPAETALAQEFLALKARIAEARERADRLRALADHVERQAARDEHALRELEGALGLAAQMQIEQLDRELGGRRLLEVAISILEREIEHGQAVHYRDWYALLCAAGFRARGQDPLANFLAQISRSTDVEPVGQRTGRYRLRAA
jgi:hypothetical protein